MKHIAINRPYLSLELPLHSTVPPLTCSTNYPRIGTKAETEVRNGWYRAPATNYPGIGTKAETGVRNGWYRARDLNLDLRTENGWLSLAADLRYHQCHVKKPREHRFPGLFVRRFGGGVVQPLGITSARSR